MLSSGGARQTAEATEIRNDAAALGASANIIYTGDFNSSLNESGYPGYNGIVAASPSPGQGIDPGASSNLKTEKATGLSYRDDYQFVTGPVYNGTGGLKLVSGSYTVFGNNGSTGNSGKVNQSGNTALNDLGSNASTILTDLTTATDHLPVVADYAFTPATTSPTFGAISATPASPSIITGGSTAFTFTVQNTAASGANALNFTAAAGANVTGTVAGPVNVPAQATSTALSGFSFNGTTVGSNQAGSFILTDSNATNNPQTGSVSVNVYDHASPSVSGTTIALPNTIVGFNGTISTLGGLTVSNATGYRSNLKTTGATTAGPYVGIANVSSIAPGGSDTISASAYLDGTQPVGIGALNQSFLLTYADDSVLPGASANLGTTNVTVTGNVLNHASPTLSSASATFGRAMQNSSATIAATTLGNAAGTAQAGLQITSLSAGLSGGSVNDVIASGGAETINAAVVPNAATGPYSQTYSIGVSDDQSVDGWTPLTTQNLTVSGTVVANRLVTATPVSFGILHAGQSAGGSTTLSTAGDNNHFTAVTVPGGSDTLVSVAGTSTVFNADGQSETRSVTGSFPTAGLIGNTFPLATVGEGLAGEQPIPVQLAYSATVFSGSARWTGTSGSSWGTNANWQDTQAAGVQVAPGLFAGYSDSVVLDDSAAGNRAITLDGASPQLSSLTFSTTGNGYTLGQGSRVGHAAIQQQRGRGNPLRYRRHSRDLRPHGVFRQRRDQPGGPDPVDDLRQPGRQLRPSPTTARSSSVPPRRPLARSLAAARWT